MWEIVSTLVDIELGWCLLNLSMELAICDVLIYLVEGTSLGCEQLTCYVINDYDFQLEVQNVTALTICTVLMRLFTILTQS